MARMSFSDSVRFKDLSIAMHGHYQLELHNFELLIYSEAAIDYYDILYCVETVS
jgi:hypothetical protein